MKRMLAMILAGGRVGELGVLTLMRPKSAVPFWGIYRVIDFPLSNLMHSGIENVGVLSQYSPSSLVEHLEVGRPWNLYGRNRGIEILPPYQSVKGFYWYKGTAHALYHNIDFIRRHAPDRIIVLSGDHVYRMDYREMLAFHIEKKADLTIAFKPVPWKEASLYGLAEIDNDQRVINYEEKPKKPKSNFASLTIYIFQTPVVIEYLERNARYGKTFQLYDEVIPEMVKERRVYAYIFEGYWQYTRTLDMYYNANMDLLSPEVYLDFQKWRVRTNYKGPAKGEITLARFTPSSRVRNSCIADGCLIEGEVENSILSPGVTVAKDASVVDSILMTGTVVEKGARLAQVITDRFVRIDRDCQIGVEGERLANKMQPTSLTRGATVIGRRATLPPKCRVGKNVMIWPGLSPEDIPSEIPSGSCIQGKES